MNTIIWLNLSSSFILIFWKSLELMQMIAPTRSAIILIFRISHAWVRREEMCCCLKLKIQKKLLYFFSLLLLISSGKNWTIVNLTQIQHLMSIGRKEVMLIKKGKEKELLKNHKSQVCWRLSNQHYWLNWRIRWRESFHIWKIKSTGLRPEIRSSWRISSSWIPLITQWKCTRRKGLGCISFLTFFMM